MRVGGKLDQGDPLHQESLDAAHHASGEPNGSATGRGSYITAAVVATLRDQLLPVDDAVLRSFTATSVLTGRQIQRLHFPGGDATAARRARRRLARLVELQILDRLPRQIGGVRAGSAGFIYVLGPAGQWLVSKQARDGQLRIRRINPPGALFLAHRLAVSELYVRLREATVDAERADATNDDAATIPLSLELLDFVAEPGCWRQFVGDHGRTETLKPDAALRIGLGEFEEAWFVELDMGTESGTAIHIKADRYGRYFRTGREQAESGLFPRVLWVAPDDTRARQLTAIVRRLQPVPDLHVVTTLDHAIETLRGPP